MLAKNKSKGFTLIELSIVLIIIGLIVSSIIGVKQLVYQAKIRAVISEYHRYDNALVSFKEQFRAIPGDMSNAWDYWGSDCATSSAVCNGNGNYEIPIYYFNTEAWEMYKFWKHLSLADMISDRNYVIEYTGNTVLDVHIPKSIYEQGGWYMNKYEWWSANIDSVIGNKHRFNLGAKRPNLLYHAPLFFVAESYSIDLKIDDGFPYTGKVVSHGGHNGVGYLTGVNPNCVSGTGATAVYNIQYTMDIACNMMFQASGF